MPTHATAPIDEVVIRSTSLNVVVALLRGFGGTVCVLAAASGAGGIAGEAGFGLLGAVVLVLALRTLGSGASIGAERLVIHGLLRSYRLSLDAIEDVQPFRPPLSALRFRLRGDKRVTVIGCGAYGRGQLERMASAIRAAANRQPLVARSGPGR